MTLLATPFHARAAEANRHNAWETRGGFTLASWYSDAEEEAIAARFGAVIADISWHWRVELSGARAVEFVSRLLTRDVSALEQGSAMEALWLNDAGAVRGAGTVVRLSDTSFLLICPEQDADWIAAAARLYQVEVRDRTHSHGVLSLIGPATLRLLQSSGIEASLASMTIRKTVWRGLDIMVSRLGLGFELWCEPDSALIAWDRLHRAGRNYALRPAGQEALDIVEFESGVMRPGRDYAPARGGVVAQPTPQSLGLSAFVDPGHPFNGRTAVMAAGPDTSPGGVLIDGEMPVAEAPLTHQGRSVGRTLASRFSPALRGAVAFGVLNGAWPASDVIAGATPCRLVALPFVPIPVPIGATESLPAAVQGA